MVEVREARYFIAVAEELHFGRAAERLHMSQPPLSQAIKAIEGRLGVSLLQRSTREVRLTPAGSVFLNRCRALVAIAEDAGVAARQAASGQLGDLRIGAVTSAFTDPLPQILRAFGEAHPRVEVRLEEVDTHVAVQALRDHRLDVAVVRKLATAPDLQRERLRQESFVLAVPAALAGMIGRNALRSAAELPWIWLPREISPDYHDQVVACCRSANFSPEARHLARSITSQLTMVACGLGVALVPENAARPDQVEHMVLFDIGKSVAIELAVVWRQGTNAVIDGFLTCARAVSG
jgi:DNA-binding transcriptional LysR family regulator